MIRVAWRQFRTQALVTLGLLAVFAALVIVLGLHLRDEYDSCIPLRSCAAAGGTNAVLADLLGPALIAIPALLGMFWGAPLVARELESGTFRLAWTQSVTRRRWLSIRLGLVGTAVLAVAVLASWLVSWALAPIVAINMNRFAPSMFTARGIVAIGYAAFAFALGVSAGAVIRRTLPAMVTTLLGFVATRVVFTLWVRPDLLASRQILAPVTAGKGVGFVSAGAGVSVAPGVPPIPNAWIVSDTLIDRTHGVLGAPQLQELLVRTCPTITNGPAGSAKADAVATACQQRLSHHLLQLVTYQPASHYWPLQALETGIFLAAALALIAAAVWWIGPRAGRRRSNSLDPKEPMMTHRRRPPVLTSLIVALLVAGCGSGSPASTTVAGSSGPPTEAQQEQQLVVFSDCMRSHGVSNFPDPASVGFKFQLAPSTPHTPAFLSAYSVCRHLLPDGGGSASERHSPAQIAAFVGFAACMRSHGFTNFPDPTGSGQLNHEMLASAGINLHLPAVVQAADACTAVTHGLITKTIVARFVAGQ
jgi:hypothetical protein